MRFAAREDVWRRLAASPTRTRTIEQISCRDLAGFEPDSITFSFPITAICGANGVGKTALLKAIWAAVDLENASQSKAAMIRLGTPRIDVRATFDGNERIYTIDLAQPLAAQLPEPSFDVIHVDASAIATQLQRTFIEKEDIDAILNGVDPIPLAKDHLEFLSYLVGKDYADLKIYEVEEGGITLPYFKAVEYGISYDCRTMGLGEICVLYIFWQLYHAAQNSIILLEEPESFISPIAQSALMDLIAKTALEKQLTVILTTHSPAVIQRLTSDAIRFVIKTATGARVLPVATRESALRRLGLRPENKVLLAVEDGVAREFTRLWLGAHNVDVLDRIEIIDVGGAANVTAARRGFPIRARMMRLIGIYDGDQRGLIAGDQAIAPLAFLPGDQGVERTFRTFAPRSETRLAELTGRSKETVAAALAGLAGIDDHEWLNELARHLGISFEQIMITLFRCWFEEEKNKRVSQAAFDKLAPLLA